MNIAYIIPSLAHRGPILVVKELVEQMVRKGHKCTVFYFDHIVEVNFSCPVFKINLWQKITFDKFEIIHTHGLRPDLYVFLHRSKRDETKCITTMHNYVLRDFSLRYGKLIAFICGNLWMAILNRHDRIVTLSLDAKKYYHRWFSLDRLQYCYNARTIPNDSVSFSADEKENIFQFKGKSILIGVNANLTPIKGVDMLINALLFLPDYKLYIVGDGKSMMSLKELVKKKNLQNRVFFAGYKIDAYRYLKFYDIYAIPSRNEGFPLALLEAAASTVPVVCSDIAVFKELYSPDEVSFFILENIESLVEAIKYATNNKIMAKRMHQKYLSCYSTDLFYKRYMEIYQS